MRLLGGWALGWEAGSTPVAFVGVRAKVRRHALAEESDLCAESQNSARNEESNGWFSPSELQPFRASELQSFRASELQSFRASELQSRLRSPGDLTTDACDAPLAMQAKSWLLLVEARVRAMCPPRYRDEVASEVLTSMWETARQPPGVKCPIALATALIPRFMGRHRRHEDRIRVTPPEHLDEMRSRGRLAMESCPFEFLLRSGLLVGWRQRRIVVCRLVGLDYHEIAQDLGTKVGEVNRVLQKLVEKLRRRRRLESAVFRLRS